MADETTTKEPVQVPSDTNAPPIPPEIQAKAQQEVTTAQLTTPEAKKKSTVKDVFLRLSGYDAEDIIDIDEAHRTIVTGNGGKYLLSKNVEGGIRILKGPAYPKLVEAEE